MKTRFLVAALASFSVAGAASAALSNGQTLGIDFGDGTHAVDTPGVGEAHIDGTGSEANFGVLAHADGVLRTGAGAGFNQAGVAIATDITGTALTGVTFTTAGFGGFLGVTDDTGYGTGGVGNYAGTPYSDLSFNDGIFRFGGGTSTITIAGLDDSLTYNLSILGSIGADRSFGATIANPSSGVSGSYTGTGVLNGGTDPIQPLLLTGLTTDGSGNVVITVGNSPAVLQALTLTAVPEPGSLALLGLGGLMIARRRRG